MLSMPIHAHGVRIHHTVDVVVEITAAYDSGEPMAGAQVSVYAPDDPSTPWLTGVCDDEGRFSFAPDVSRPGTWTVRVRQAGHGDIVYISVGGSSDTSGRASGYAPLQIVLMAVCVVWGSVGTALYFSRRRR
ncbi:MAG: carboxypeptidase regulatory-like domain-containing protein [Dehalococcoidia bacterium]|nr:carboxypeptidase regulatory-like domain-containing protein [Dehalococcoidia bacterium]